MKKTVRVKKASVIFIIAILASVIVEGICNFNIIRLPENESKIQVVEKKNIKAKGFADKSEGFYIKGGEGTLRFDWDGSYIDKLEYDFQTSDFVDATITMGVVNALGKEDEIKIEDKNPIVLARSTVNIKRKVNWISISIPSSENGSGILIQNIRVNNNMMINKYRILMTIMTVLGISVIIIQWKKISEKIEYGFLIISLVCGIIFVVAIPTNKVGWDEETHFKRAYELAIYPGEENLTEQIEGQFRADTPYNYPFYQPGSYEEKRQLDSVLDNYYENKKGTVLVKGEFLNIYNIGLIPHACAIKMARYMGMSFHIMYLAGRMAGLLLYIITMFWAIKIIPTGKRMLLFIALTPTSIFLATTYTYDTMVFGFVSVFIALIMREWIEREGCINARNIVTGNAIFLIGCLPKAIYAPLALIPLLLQGDRYKNKKQKMIARVSSVIVFHLLFSSFFVPQLLNPESAGDPRGEGVNSPAQTALILHKPVTYICVAMKNIFRTLPDYMFGTDSFRLLGHLGEAKFMYLVPIMAVFLLLTDFEWDKMKKINIRDRICIFVLCMMSIGLIWTALYISFTKVGVTKIEGVQGRYYRPLLWIIYLVFSSKYVQVNISTKRYNQIVFGITGLIIGVTVGSIFGRFCV